MHGSFSNQDREAPECATYPRSIGRTGNSASTLFSRRCRTPRLQGNIIPIRMTWNEDDYAEECPKTPERSENVLELLKKVPEVQESDPNCEGVDDEQDHYDPEEVSYGQYHDKVPCDSFLEHTHGETTYPTSSRYNRLVTSEHPFSVFAVPQKGGVTEATPLKSLLPVFPKTEEKRRRPDMVLDGHSWKTPLPDRNRSEMEDGKIALLDSGIGVTKSKTLLTERNKGTVRGLFTPSVTTNFQSDFQDSPSNVLHTQNKPTEADQMNSVKKQEVNTFGSHLTSKPRIGKHQTMNGETPYQLSKEKQEIMGLAAIQKSEKKNGKGISRIEDLFSESNKENFSYGHELVPSHMHKDGENEEHKLVRSHSHASLLKADDKFKSPSKEDKHSSSKSLMNLFQSNQVVGAAHASRIPTPIRLHTPNKLNPPTPKHVQSTLMETSCVEMLDLQTPMKYSNSPPKKEMERRERKRSPEQKPVDMSSPERGVVAPVFSCPDPQSNHLLLNNPPPFQASKMPSSYPEINPKHSSGIFTSNDEFKESLKASNTKVTHESQFSSKIHQQPLPFSSGVHQQMKLPSFPVAERPVICETKEDKPSYIFQMPSKSLHPQCAAPQNSSSNNHGSNNFIPPAAVLPSASQKPFSLKAPTFQVPRQSNPICDAKVTFSTADTTPPMLVSNQTNANQIHFSSAMFPPTSVPESVFPIAHERQLEFSSHREDIKPAFHFQNERQNHFSSANQILDRQPSNPHMSNGFHSQVCGQQVPHPGSVMSMQSRGDLYDAPQQVHGVNPSYPQSGMNSFNQGNGAAYGNVALSNPIPQPIDNVPNRPVEMEPKPMARDVPERPINVQTNRTILVVNKRSYEVLRLLGKGASSKVYHVLDCQTNCCFAVKKVVLRQDDPSVEGYLKEVELLNQLQGSECIIRLIDSEVRLSRGNKVLYMVMERGEMDLSTSIKLMSMSKAQQMPAPGQPGGKIPIVTVIFYWVSMLNAVDEIHKKGIVHSDLKPANFLLVGSQLKLIDFGIASAVQVDMTSIVKNDPAGTPNYMSPEAIGLSVSGSPDSEDMFKNPKASFKSDVWSLGCILYSLIYGRSPFQHITNECMKLDAIRNPKFSITYPSSTSVHPPLLRALKRCLVRDYHQRASIAELKAIDYLCGSDLDEETWDMWKATATEKILSALSPECKLQAIKVIQEVFKSPPRRKIEP